jgi:hypothetical protein
LSYTERREVDAAGSTIDELCRDLDRRYPGIRFRMIDEQDQIRPHMRVFVNGELIHDTRHPLRVTDDVQIVQALSGG